MDVVDAIELETKKKIKHGGRIQETWNKRKIQDTGLGNRKDLGDNQVPSANADYAADKTDSRHY